MSLISLSIDFNSKLTNAMSTFLVDGPDAFTKTEVYIEAESVIEVNTDTVDGRTFRVFQVRQGEMDATIYAPTGDLADELESIANGLVSETTSSAIITGQEIGTNDAGWPRVLATMIESY